MNTTENTPRELNVDVLVIGWGKGGKTFAGAMAGKGKSVAIVERSAAMYGGTCINIGCVPTKTLVHSASTRRDGDDAQSFFDQAVARRDALIGKLNQVNFNMLGEKDTVTVVDGFAQFIGPKSVEVTPSAGGKGVAEHLIINAETIIINVGATPVMPNIPGIDLEGVYDSTSIQHAKPFPKRLGIIGSGPIGLEFASMFNDFGAEVTVIERAERLLGREDEDVAAAVTKVLEDDGIVIKTGVSVTALTKGDDGITVELEDGQVGPFDGVLVSVGRRPATDNLGLDKAGIEVTERGAVKVDDQLRTNVEGVYAMGDVHGGPQQTYLSLDDHRIVLDQIAGKGERKVSDRVAVPATMFISPAFSTVGLTETQAREEGYDVKVVNAPVATIKAMPRPKAVGDPRGLIKIVVDKNTDQILGARLFHVDSQEVINLIALAMRAKVTASELRDGIWTHPASTEALNEVLAQLQ